MSKSLGPIEITCDSPPYFVVRACRHIGIRSPEDVPWRRLGQFLDQRKTQVVRRGFFLCRFLGWLFGKKAPEKHTCSCGRKLPVLGRFAFALNTGEEESYRIGQCKKCRTVFWEEV